MPNGNVKEYDTGRGCGIIVDSDKGEQLTVYANYICQKDRKILKEGQKVEYEIENNRHQNWAVNVRIIEESLPKLLNKIDVSSIERKLNDLRL